MNTRGCFLLFLVCFVSFAVSKHTLRVDTVLPAATNSVLIRNLTADVLDIGQADIQFIKLDLQDEDPFVINTNGSISFNGNVVGLDSNLFVNITAGQRGTVSTPDALELQGDLLALNGERFLFNAGGDIYLNTQGSIRAAASLITIGSQTEIDLHTGSGSIEALAKEQVIVSGQEIHYQGDDRISLYSYGNVNVDAAESFRAYANFIDFDSFGDIRLSSLTGNVELDTIYNLVFEGGNVNVNTNEGVDLASVHGEVYVAANDNLLVEAQSTLFVDVFDKMHYFATNQFSINAGTFAANVDSSVHVHGKTAEFVFAESEIYTHDLIAKTGGNIRFLLDSTAPNAPYNFTADEGISFTSRNILTNSTELILSSRQDLELLANERFSSVLSLTSTAQEIVAGNDVSFSGAVVVLNSATTNLQAGQDVVLLANNAIGGEVALNGGTSVSITAGDDVNVLSRNGRIVSSAVTFQANTNIFETGSAVDSEFLISSADTTITMNAASSFTQYSKYGGLNYLITQFNNNNNTYIVTAGSSQVSARDDVIILGNQLTITATGNSASPASPNAGVQLSTGVLHLSSNAATINTSDDARFTGKYVDVFVNGEGAFTAGQSVRVSTTTEDASVTYDAFRDILIEQLDRLVARDELRFESGNTLGLTALNGISFINDGITQVVGGSRNSITFNGKIASISATNAITANTGFLTIRAADDFNLNGGSLTLRTEDEENINILLDGSYTLTSNSNTEPFGQSYRSDDDLLIRANDFVSVSQTGNQLVQATQQFDVHAHEWSSNSTLGDLNLLAENDVLFALSGVSTVTVNGDYTLQFSRSIEQSTQSDFTLIAGGAFNIAAPIISLINDSPLASSGTNTISGADDFVQNGNTVSIQGGSLSVVAGGDFASTAAQSILHASVFVSMYNTTGDIVFNDDAVREARIRLESADFESNSGGDILLTGGNVFINSSNSEPIDLSSSGDVTVTSNNNTGISWYSERDFNTTALQGLRIEAFNPANATTGLSFLSTASKNSNATSFPEGNSLIELFTRQGKTTVNSLLSQTYRAENIQLRAGGDIHYNNFNRTNLVGGVSFRSNGTAHDGLYQDQAGITVRSSSTLGTINVAAPRGSIDVNAGENLELASTESAALFLAKLDIPLVASTGNLSLSAEQGAILLQANRKSVTFTTSESNTEISSSQSFFGLAGGQIVLTSSQVIDSTTNPNQLSFEFSALAGGIEEVTRGGNPINYQANDYLLRAAENATFTASDDVLLTARQGVLEAMANSGFEWVVSNGDLNLTTTSGSINVRSGADSNIDVLSGGDSRWTVQQGVNFTTGDNLLFRTERGDFVVRTNDTQSDILFTSDGATVFQADGVSNNVGQAFQDGIYVVGPLIQSESTGSATFDAKGRFVVGLTTRPIITLDAGGNGDYLGVEFTAVGNIQHTVGQDFTITTQGAFLQHTDQNLNMNAGGDFSLRSLGTSDAGKNVRIEGEGTVQINAGTVSTNAQARTTVQSEDALTITSTGANPATSYINIDVTNQLRIDVNETLDINGNTWLVQADTFTLTTLGSVEFVNSNAAGVITLSADSVLGFSSDGTTSFTTSGPAAPLTLTSFGSNSNIDFETRGVLSDILIRANASLIIDAENEASLETTRSFTLTAPLNRLGQSNNSNIAFNSDQDLLFSAGYDLTASSLGATNITTTGAGSDIDFVSGGQALLQSWQNMTFASLNENILIQNGFNVELSSREGGNGSVSIASTRDLLLNFNTATPADRTPNVASYIEGDQTIVARGTYSVRVFDGALTLQAAEDNGDLLFTAQNGPIIITTTNQLELRGGDLGFTSQGKQTITSTGTLDVETNGLQNSINLFSEQGLLQFFATEFNFNAEYQPTGTTEADDFRSYIEFTAKGTNTVGKYSILFDNPDSSFTVTSENGGFDLLSSAANNVTATESFTLSAASVNGKVEFLAEADFGAMEFEATTSFELNTPEDGFINIRAGNDTSFFPTGPMTVTAADDITIESFHGDGSIRLFTTDRLIGDISVDAVNFNSYSWDNSTYLLIDDDDTAFVGTYLTTAPQIYMAADNDVVIEEIGLGDIEFNSAGNWLFTAGGNIIMEVRERFEVDVGALLVESESDIYYYSRSFNIIATEDINFNARSDISFVSWRQDLTTTSPNLSFLVDPSAQDSNNVGGNDITFTASSLMTLGAAGADIFLASSSNSNAGPTTVDFRNGMQIPFRTIGADGDPCATAGLFFFQSTSNRFCFCNSSSQLDCIVATPFTADYLF